MGPLSAERIRSSARTLRAIRSSAPVATSAAATSVSMRVTSAARIRRVHISHARGMVVAVAETLALRLGASAASPLGILDPAGTQSPRVPHAHSEDEVKKPMQMGSGTERDNVVSTLVYVHESVGKVMVMLKRNTGKRSYVT